MPDAVEVACPSEGARAGYAGPEDSVVRVVRGSTVAAVHYRRTSAGDWLLDRLSSCAGLGA